MTREQTLIQHFKSIGLSELGASWLLVLWEMTQTLDDIVDGDEVTRQEKDSLIFNALILYPTHPYFIQHSANLAPVIATSIFKWQASDLAERSGTHNHYSFVWRAAFYDVILMVMCLDCGHNYAMENSHLVMQMIGETYADYQQEFDKWQTQ